MLDNLTQRLSSVIKAMRGQARLTEDNIGEALREVILHADGAPVVLAHSIACHRDLSGVWRRLRGLGNRPLAAALFANPLVERGVLEFARVDSRHPLWRRAAKVFGPGLPPLWARRSLFRLAGRPLLVTEVFLPGILRLK